MARKPSKARILKAPRTRNSGKKGATISRRLPGHRKLSEAALYDSEERLRAILETAVEGIITIDEKGIIEAMNPAAEKIFGWKSREVVGRNVSMLMPAPYRQEHDGYLHNYLKSGHAKIIGIGREVMGQRKDGTVFPMDLAVSEVALAGRRIFSGFVRDISERKRAEQRHAELTQSLAEISERERQRIGQDLHDGLCQHLAGIELMSRVLEQKLAPYSRADAAQAGEIARLVREAIGQTRSLARGLAPSSLQSEGLVSALQELVVTTEKMFGVQCRFEHAEPVSIADLNVATHLYRIAQEAVSNAIKHGRAKCIVIKLAQPREGAMLSISDDGVGFPKVPARNQGMGLRIMQYRAGVIGGNVAMKANPNRGTTVVCTLPLKTLRKRGGPV